MSTAGAPQLSRSADIRRRMRGTGDRGRKLKGLVRLLRPYRGRVALMFLTLFAATAAAIAPAPLAKMAIDKGITPKDVGALDQTVALFVASAVVYLLATAAQTWLTGWVGQRALADLRMELFQHLQTLSVDFYSKNRSGVIISRLTNDVEALDSLVSDGIVSLFQGTLTLFGTAAVLLYLDSQLALATFAVVPVLWIGGLLYRIASADIYRRTRERIAAITSYLQETLSGIRVVRSFGQEPRHMTEFAGLNEANRAENMKTVYLNASYFPAVEMLSAAVTAGILLVGGAAAVSGRLTVGVVFAFVAALNNFFDPISQLSQLYTTYQSGMAALDKIFELLDTEADIVDQPSAVDLPHIDGRLSFDAIHFGYAGPDGAMALNGITFEVPAGTSVALVGETGAGKSTLAKLVARFHDPTAGRMLVDGHDLREVTARSLRSQMGIVPQEPFLFSGTLADNIGFGLQGATRQQIIDAGTLVGLDAVVESFHEGWDAPVGERGVQLSSGQRQLVAFARALVSDPRILVLDEATANVDVHTEERIEEALEKLLVGRTAVIIAHRLSTIRTADLIVVLEHGRVVESGNHDELIAAGGHFSALHRDWMDHAGPLSK
ncbi:MAG: ABC transporter ATP-binding protein [Solirubrobacterales bacterium]|nr:ABC transporter ATP-binding protein [Solirubrobacterales bacterium]